MAYDNKKLVDCLMGLSYTQWQHVARGMAVYFDHKVTEASKEIIVDDRDELVRCLNSWFSPSWDMRI